MRIPAGVTGADGTDGTLVVIDHGAVYDFWAFRRSSTGTGSAAAYAMTSHSGSGWGSGDPFRAAGIRAAGTSALGGLITGGDWFSGDNTFRHALAVSLLGSELNGFVAPAINGEGGSGTIPMGARLGIPRGTPMPADLSPTGQRMWNTLVTYGAYVVDQHGGSAPVIFYADPRSVGPGPVALLRDGDLDRIMPSVRIVQ